MKFASSLIKPAHSLKVKKLVVDISNLVKEELKDMSLDRLKIDPDVILFIATQIENSFSKKKDASYEKIDKKKMFLEILKKLIPNIQPQEEEIIITILEHLHSNGRIKKVSTWKCMKGLSSFFLKKAIK